MTAPPTLWRGWHVSNVDITCTLQVSSELHVECGSGDVV